MSLIHRRPVSSLATEAFPALGSPAASSLLLPSAGAELLETSEVAATAEREGATIVDMQKDSRGCRVLRIPELSFALATTWPAKKAWQEGDAPRSARVALVAAQCLLRLIVMTSADYEDSIARLSCVEVLFGGFISRCDFHAGTDVAVKDTGRDGRRRWRAMSTSGGQRGCQVACCGATVKRPRKHDLQKSLLETASQIFANSHS